MIRTIGEPIEVKRAPETGYMAQFSGPYAVAVGLLGGGGLGAGLDDYTDELAQDPQRRALMQKVDVVADDRCDEIFPHQFPAVLTRAPPDGTELVEEVLTNRGGPRPPARCDELATKFRDNVRGSAAPPETAGTRCDDRVLAACDAASLGVDPTALDPSPPSGRTADRREHVTLGRNV